MTRVEKKRYYMRNLRADWRSSGMCQLCGQHPAQTGRSKCLGCTNYQRASRDKIKIEAFNAYGGPFCACCGESNVGFLTIDHVNNDGAKQRKETNQRCGNSFYRWLKTHNYPIGYRVLCFNCNCGREHNGGICPHEQERQALLSKLPSLLHY